MAYEDIDQIWIKTKLGPNVNMGCRYVYFLCGSFLSISNIYTCQVVSHNNAHVMYVYKAVHANGKK